MSKIIKNNVEYANSADTKVTQTASSNNADYEVLFSGTADNTTRTEGVGKTNRLLYNPANGRLFNKMNFADASKSDNGVSADTWQGLLLGVDNSKRIISVIEDSVRTNGNITTSLLVRNYDTSGTQVANKGISLIMNKSGNLTYTVSDNANFRSAIGLGVTNISSQYSSTKTSGNWSVSGITAYRCGNVIQMQIAFKGNGNSVSAGSNAFVGTISGGPLPIIGGHGVSFISSSCIIVQVASDGGVTVRVTGAACTLASTSTTSGIMTYLISD